MKLSWKYKILTGIGVFVIILIVTNPSASALKEHLGAPSTVGMERKYNFFVCSIFQYDDEYVGLLGNFFEIKKDTPTAIKSSNSLNISDTTVANDTKDTSIHVGWIYKTNNAGETLYDTLVKSGYTVKNLGTKDSFLLNVKISKKVKKLYNGLIGDGYKEDQLGSEQQFIYYLSKN